MIKNADEMEMELSLGFINWYPWTPGASIYFAGDFSNELKQDILRRGVVEKANAPYDYIIAVRVLEEADNPSEILTDLRGGLKPDGHLFLVCENRLALRYFAGDHDPYTDRNFDGIENYYNLAEQDKQALAGRCYARFEIERFLDEAGLYRRRGYSILPGLAMPQQIYAWDYLPEENLAIRYTPLYNNPQSIFLNAPQIYDSLIQNGMFHQMANAYLIDCTMDGTFYEVNHVTVSMDRGEENATATLIQKNEVVKKMALYPSGNARMDALLRHTSELAGRGISVVPMEYGQTGVFDGISLTGVEMPYMKAPTALEYLRGLAFQNKDEFIRQTCTFLDMILASSREVEESENDKAELGPFFEKAYIDLVPLNCFYKDGHFVAFDQEFCEGNYPIKVVLARALDIIYMGDKAIESIVPIAFFTQRYGMEQKLGVFRTMGDTYIKKLRNRDVLVTFNSQHLADPTVINMNRQKANLSVEEYNRIFINLLSDVEGKKVFVFGSGMWARKFVAEYGEKVPVVSLLDNNRSKQGDVVDGIEVCSPDILETLDPDRFKVIICIKQYSSVLLQLKQMGVRHYGVYDPNIDRPVSGIAIEKAEHQYQYKNTVVRGKVNVDKKYHLGYIAGVFDLFHIGHLNLLRRAKEQCDILLVGVVSDQQASTGKARSPYVNENERLEIVGSCKYVDKAFILPIVSSGTRDVYRKYHFDVQFSGSDYEHDPTWLAEQAWLRERGADLVFLPYTESTSSTKLKKAIEGN